MSQYYPRAVIQLRILPEDFQLTSDASLQRPYKMNVMAKNLTVNRNDYRTTSSFSCELDYRSFPFDPRALRYVGVAIYIEDMGSLYNQDGTDNALVPNADNAVFAGFVDEESVTLDESKQIVHFEGRDFTSLLIDQKYKESAPISLDRDVGQIIQGFLSTFKATQEIQFINRTGQTQLPILSNFYPNFSDPLSASKNPGPKESYWEIILDIVSRAGLICYIELDKFILTTPRNLYSPAKDLKIIYGQNISHLSFKRKLGRLKNFNILVRSRVGAEVVEARIPAEATQSWCDSFGIPKAEATIPVLKPDGSLDTTQIKPAPYIAFPVPGMGNKDQLVQIGQTTYEEFSRQQLEGKFETKEMEGHSGESLNSANYSTYDLTHLAIGQPIAIEIQTDDLNAISRLATEESRRQYMIKRGYEKTVAVVLAKSMGKFSPRFYTKSYAMTVDEDNGFKLSVDFINIIDLSHRGL